MPRVLISLTGLALILLTGCGVTQKTYRAESTHQLTAEHVAGSSIAIETRNGTVEIHGNSGANDVAIEARLTCAGASQEQAELRLSESSIEITRLTDGTLTIKPVFPDNGRSNDGASFTIHIPDASGVMVHTSNGSVRLTKLSGHAEVTCANGSVAISNHDGSANITTSNDNVVVNRLTGPLTVSGSNCAVTAEHIGGAVHINSSNGSIQLATDANQQGPIDLHTSNGSVKARLGSQFAGKINLNTSNGEVTVTDSAHRVTSRHLDRSSGSITVGSGGRDSRIATSNGRIEIEVTN